MRSRTRCVVNVPAAGAVKIGLPVESFVANHWPPEPNVPIILGVPLTPQYWPFTPQPKFESKPTPAKSLDWATPHGLPVWNWVTPLICQPPSNLPDIVV